MKTNLIAAILATAFLPALAQAAVPSTEPRPAAPAQLKEDKARAEKPLSARERAKAAKAEQKKNRQLARQKQEPKKKAPAA